jgi:methionyl-tRNA synthetase
MRELISLYLSKENYHVVTAEDGLQALERLEKEDVFSLFLIDVMMPNMDGFSLCKEIKRISDKPVIFLTARGVEYERLMARYEFHQIMNLMDTYLRNINKVWSKNMKLAEEGGDMERAAQVLADSFHMVRTAAALMHPIAPEGTEMIRNYLVFNESFWNWETIFEPVYAFMDDPEQHQLKFLEPRVDFFRKHPSQLKGE